MSAGVLGAVHAAIGAWDWVLALLVVVVAVVLEQTGIITRAVAIVTLFAVSLLVFALLFTY